MRLINLAVGEKIEGLFAGWSDWYFTPENQLEVDWLPVLSTSEGETVALSNNAGLMARFRTATLGGEIKEGDVVRVDCTGETQIDAQRRMKDYTLKVGNKVIEDHRIVSVPPVFLRDQNQLQLPLEAAAGDGKKG